MQFLIHFKIKPEHRDANFNHVNHNKVIIVCWVSLPTSR